MLHFFPTFSNDASKSPFAQELRALGVPHRLFAGKVSLRYQSRLGMVLLGWPQLAWFALKCALRSLVWSRPRPSAVIVGSDIEAIIFGLVRLLRWSPAPRIVLLGFILTARRSALANRVRLCYFKFVFFFVDQVICHSRLEVRRYQDLFGTKKTQFVYIPYGLHITGREQKIPDESRTVRPCILAAGRSGRDYRTLLAAVADLPVDLHIVCDRKDAFTGLDIPPNVTVLDHCYDGEYVRELRHAHMVVIPLSVSDISAGQMVLIQALAYGKPTIITSSPTVQEYVRDQEHALLVPLGKPDALRAAIERLLTDATLAATLSANAAAIFEQRFCMRAYVGNLVDSVTTPTARQLAAVNE